MVSAGLMPDDQSTVLLEGDADDAIGAGISVEPEGGSEQPTEVVALFDLGAGVMRRPQTGVAVVGSGVAGPDRGVRRVQRTQREVTLYEADDRLAGMPTPTTSRTRDALAIDTGFIVHNERTYPTLLRMFAELGVAHPGHRDVDVDPRRRHRSGVGRALGGRGLFPDLGATSGGPAYLRMLREIPRFHRAARAAPGQRRRDHPGPHAWARSSPTTASPRTSPGTSWSRSSPPSGRATPRSRWTTRPATCSPSSTTTACSASSARRRGRRSSAARGPTSNESARWSTTSASAPRSRSVDRDSCRRRDRRRQRSRRHLRRRRHRHPPRPGPVDCWPPRRRPSARCCRRCRTPPTRRCCTPTGRCCRGRVVRGASWNFRRVADDRGRVTVTYDLTRLMRLPTETHYLVTLGGEDLVDPAKVRHRPPRPTPSDLHARVRRAAGAPACMQHPPCRVRRGLPRLGVSTRTARVQGWGLRSTWAWRWRALTRQRSPQARQARPLRNHGRASPTSSTSPTTPAVYRSTITHQRRRPWKRTFTHRSHTWLVDLDDLPGHGFLATFEARDHLGWPHATLRGNVTAFLARHDIDLTTPAGPGRILMVAHPRAFGHCFNPITRVLVLRRSRASGGHGRGGAQHLRRPARLSRRIPTGRAAPTPTSRCTSRRSTASTGPTSSRCHPRRTAARRGDAAHRRRGRPSAPVVSGRGGVGGPGALRRGVRPQQASARPSCIRMHGVWLWARRLRVQPRPTTSSQGVP